MKPKILAVAALASAAGWAAPAGATETITYRYDVHGRLIAVERTGPVNKVTTYKWDKADNRIEKKTSP